MEFMEAYKRLDNFCKDMNGIGVTGYIKDMEVESIGGLQYVSSWKSDYKMLKHYRYIRNQIAHENYASENNLCTLDDQVWINKFYERLMRQEDPLAMYYKIKQNKKDLSYEEKRSPILVYNESDIYKKEEYSIGCIIGMMLIFSVIVLLIIVVLTLMR